MPRVALIVSLVSSLLIVSMFSAAQEKAHGTPEPGSTQEPTEQDKFEARYLADLNTYFEPDPAGIEYLSETNLPLAEYPILLEVAKRSGESAKMLYQTRARGDSWGRILSNHGLTEIVFYVIIATTFESETYSPIYAKYAAVPESQWNSVALTDPEIVSMANLKFIASQHDYSVFEVMKLHDEGLEFVELNAKVKELKDEMIKEQKKASSKSSKDKEEVEKKEEEKEESKDSRRP